MGLVIAICFIAAIMGENFTYAIVDGIFDSFYQDKTALSGMNQLSAMH